MTKATETLEVRRPAGLSEAAWTKLGKVEPTTRQVAVALLEGRVSFDLDPEAIAADIARRILEAPDTNAALQLGVAVHAREILGQPIVITGFRFQESGFDSGPGAYAVLDAVNDDTGEGFAVTCGGVNVMAQLIRLAMDGDLPKRVKIIETDRQTKQGYYPMWLVPA